MNERIYENQGIRLKYYEVQNNFQPLLLNGYFVLFVVIKLRIVILEFVEEHIMEIIIREAKAEDAVEIIAYTKIIGGETENLTFGGTGFPVTIEQEEKFLKSVYGDKTSVHLVACKDGELIGDGSLSGLPRRMCHRAELGIAVRKNYWGQGIGSLLMKELINYAKENGIEILNLDVRSDNVNAIHLYEKFGFKHIGTSPAFFKIDGKYVDFELMYLDLR